jgi:hypothetical protein
LLQPVRDHFANDPQARDILDRVKEIKKEDHTGKPKTFRRMKALDHNDKVTLVIAPLPSVRTK